MHAAMLYRQLSSRSPYPAGLVPPSTQQQHFSAKTLFSAGSWLLEKQRRRRDISPRHELGCADQETALWGGLFLVFSSCWGFFVVFFFFVRLFGLVFLFFCFLTLNWALQPSGSL